MKNLLKIAPFLLLFAFLGCNKDELSTNMETTLHLRNGDADMPIYLRGNGESKVFIIVLHGGPGGHGLQYELGDYADDLEQNYAMVYWDQRGQGMSHGSYDKSEITLDIIVEDLRKVVLLLKGKYGEDSSVFLFGHSWGGMVGTAFMVKEDYQNLVNGWIEIGGAHDFPLLRKEATKKIIEFGNQEISAGRNTTDWQDMLDFAEALDTNSISRDDFLEINSFGHQIESKKLVSAVNDSDLGGGEIAKYLLLSPTNLLTSTLTGLQTNNHLADNGILDISLTDDLPKITQPTLLLWGRFDFIVPPALGTSAFSHIGSADKTLIFFENSGHSPMFNEPNNFVSEVVDFVERNK